MSRRIVGAALSLSPLVFGCSGAPQASGFTPADAGSDTAPPITTEGGAFADTGGGFSSDASPIPDADDDCPVETQYVYVVTADNGLYQFNPQNLSFKVVGTLNCQDPMGGSPFSMSVDRQGTAWVIFTDGLLYQVSTTNASCKATSFVPSQDGFTTFGLAFVANSSGSQQETLFVTDSPYVAGPVTVKGLATVDTQTLKLSFVGEYNTLNARAEMTGTGDGRLFGAFEGTPYVIAQIDKTNATILSQAPQTQINYSPGDSSLAFAFWGGEFWVFVGPGGYTDVFRYNPASGSTTKVVTEQFEIVGAGVSTCAPVQMPM
jgi:hypothetical protein